MTGLVPYEDAVAKYDPVFGLEVHVELGTRTKLFDSAPTEFGAEPNTQVTAVSAGLPGTLPALNGLAVEYAIRLGLALNCQIAEVCRFARKQYFYPDLAENFQTSQSDEPIAYDGWVDVELADGTVVRVDIERAHIEEDAGKNVHVGGVAGRIHGAEYSLVDYNRAGMPLVEIVTKPITGTGDRAPEVARAYVQTLRDIVRAIGVSEAKMERGHVRADVNLSLRPSPDAPLGVRTETKNVNSFRAVESAMRYEISRQAGVLDAGGLVVQETRHFHEDGTTSPGRPKSDAEDYRYFPEPDLMPIKASREWVEQIRASLPELPLERRRRLTAEWGFTADEMRAVASAGAVDLLAATVAAGAAPAAARKWWLGELARAANAADVALEELPVTPQQVAELQQLVDSGELTDKLARQVLDAVLAGEGSPAEIVASKGLAVVSDDDALLTAIDTALAAQPDVAAKLQEGNLAPIGAIIGAVMKATGGQANAARVRELIMMRTST
jgi:aspartyl-tRNA(Asn)/glutamyl-tRNA(Gln) amidotransferase subunit B